MKLSRAPALTARGTWMLGVSVGLLLVGAAMGAPTTAAMGLGGVVALVLAYVRYLPAAALLWRNGIELVWVLERASSDAAMHVGRPARMQLSLRNKSARHVGVGRLRLIASSALEAGQARPLVLPAGREASTHISIVPRQVGTWHVHGAALALGDRLGLFTLEAYFPSSRAVQVLPRPGQRALALGALAAGGMHSDKLGMHLMPRRGLSGELRELREHVPGDPFKHIAWKATARTGRLMVREVETTTLITHQLLVDVGATMRQGRPGFTKLDAAIDVAHAYAVAALAAGDRVGLTTFDGREIGVVRPGDGPAHRLRLLEPLLAATHPIDEDLTDLTDSELVEAVGRYLVHQEGVDTRVRRPPPLDDQRWSHLIATPTGELYDLRVVFRAVEAALKDVRVGAVRGATPELVRLRQFCRLRGIELPVRRSHRAGRRAAGLTRALERVASGRGTQRIVVISDLEGLEHGFEQVQRAVQLARRRGHQLVCAAPAARLFGGAAAIRDGVVAEIVFWDEQRREQASWQRLAKIGVRVVPIGPAAAVDPRARDAVREPVRAQVA